MKLGLVTMTPKVMPDGTLSSTPDKMRPITVLPTLLRVANRILNERVLRVIIANPKILHWSQNAFMKNGSTDECVDLIQDAIEECAERKFGLSKCNYDQEKAYDSVQAYRVEATLERLACDRRFTAYILSGLEGAQSAVRTWHGFSKVRTLFSGLRQGDPLSPIIYNLTIDPCRRAWRKGTWATGST